MSDNDPPLLTVRFGDDMMSIGFTAIPNLILRHYIDIKVTNLEMMFTIHVWSFWWSEQKPFPAYKTIGERMGLEWRAVQRHAKSLEKKELLKIIPRKDDNNANTSAHLDFAPFISAVLKVAKEKALHDPAHPLSKTTGGGPDRSDRGDLSKTTGKEYSRKKTSIPVIKKNNDDFPSTFPRTPEEQLAHTAWLLGMELPDE